MASTHACEIPQPDIAGALHSQALEALTEGWTGPGPGPKAFQSSDVPPLHGAGLNGMNSSIWEHFASGSFSPGTSPAFLSGPGAAELARLRQELDEANGTIKQWEESWKQAKQVRGPHTHLPPPVPAGVHLELILHRGVQGVGKARGSGEQSRNSVLLTLSHCGKTGLASQDPGWLVS